MGKHWYTNNKQQILAEECPEGFWPGRLPVSEEFRQKMANISQNRSEAEKAIISKKLSDAYNLKSDAEKDKIKNKIRQNFQNKTVEEKAAFSAAVSKGLTDMSEDAKQRLSDKRHNAWANKTEEERQTIRNKLSDAYSRHTAEEAEQIELKKAQTRAAQTPEIKLTISEKISKAWSKKSIEEKANINKKRQVTWSHKLGYDVTDSSNKHSKYVKKYNTPEEWKEARQLTYKNKSDIEKEMIKNKRKTTIIDRYGADGFTIIAKKAAQTHNSKSPEEKQKSKIKRAQTIAKKSPEWHQKVAEKISEQLQKPEIIAKMYKTRKKNKTFTVSKPEDMFYEQLVSIFGQDDIIRQYKDSRYPFACDFYVRSKDLFIELNLNWTHGQKKFENTAEDLKKLNIWKEKAKGSKFYANAIDTWTRRDVEKFDFAQKNKLNYLVAYSEQDWLIYCDLLLQKYKIKR